MAEACQVDSRCGAFARDARAVAGELMVATILKSSGLLGIVAVVALAASDADAKARYMELPEAVETAVAIGVVHTEATTDCEITGDHWTYRQKVFAEPVQMVKGVLASPFEVLAKKDFICASESFEARADYLVFLGKDDGHWVPVNHHMGVLAIDDAGLVEWPYADEADVNLTVEEAFAQIGAVMPTPIVVQRSTMEMPCGYLIGHVEAQAEADAEDETSSSTWQLPFAITIGASAMLLGIVVGFRRRRSNVRGS